MSKTYCPIPWIFHAARTNGDMRICCQANVTKNKGVIRHDDGTAYNAGRDTIESSRNAELMKVVRKNMMNGVWSEECGRCRTEEENGLNSRRKREVEDWNYTFEQAQNDTAEDGSINAADIPLRYYDLRFGNFCNLKCRMCGPTDSNTWYEDWEKLMGTNKFKESSGEVEIKLVGNKLHADGYDWPNYEPFWEELEANAHNIEHVYFAGGEPLLIDRHYEFLQKVIDSGAAKNMLIEYNTNGTTLPSKATKLWPHFKEVHIGASVDGMETMLEYQRHPAKWDKVLRNLRKIDELPTNCVSWLAVTVTAYNVNHVVDFMRWKLTESNFTRINKFKKRPIITPHVAHHPHHLNVRVLPDEMKSQITQRYLDFLQWTIDNDYPEHVVKSAENITQSITSYMNSESYHEQHWDYFKRATAKLDEIRHENLLDVEPLFKDYL